MNKEYPDWLINLLEVFLSSVEWISLNTPVRQSFTHRSQNNNGIWEIDISPYLHEIYGGMHDGELKLPTYGINLLSIADEFDKVTYIGFDSDLLEASIEGEIKDNHVFMTFRRLAPSNKPHKKINIFTGEITKIVEQT